MPNSHTPATTLRRYYRRLSSHFGPQYWWPARTRFEVILGALLTQNTSWVNVEKALNNLRCEGLLRPDKLARVSPARLEKLLRPSGYYRQKTRVVRGFLAHLQRRYGGSLRRLLARPANQLRAELLSLHGIGEETADSILLYAAGQPVFVVDAYTRRVLARHGLASETARYAELQGFFHRHLPGDASLFNEYHALLVAVGKNYCRRRAPDCAGCPLGPELPTPRLTSISAPPVAAPGLEVVARV
ncbi:MAG TPA: endonuclease III domain-containing protein [Candidatus Xenobia bacterium]|nr:endonuclease III domain-containing protein [Candidatus Xenobia bacterium]